MYILEHLFKRFFFLFLLIIFACTTEKSTPQIQSLIEIQNEHTHDIIIYYDDVRNGRDDYYTSENFGHRHRVVIDLLDREKLLLGLTIEKETEEALGHKHKLMLKILDY